MMMMQQRTSKQRSVAQETEVCATMRRIYGRGVLQPGSGNQPGKPNDVYVADVAFIECKDTAKSSMSVKYAWLHTLRKSAMLTGLRTFLAIRFGDSSTNYYIVEDHVIEHLLKCERELLKLVEH